MPKTGHYDVVVIGAGQAGLSTGYYLAKRKADFVIIDRGTRPGGSWRERWDSLRLFTPAFQNDLPGMRFPARPLSFPTCSEMADYLEAYAKKYAPPIHFDTTVKRVGRDGDVFVIETSAGDYTANHVVVASGAHVLPATPDIAEQLSPSIVQVHSMDYRNPEQLQPGPVLVVGAANSGADIALDLARDRKVWLSGRHPGNMPFRIDSFKGKVVLPFYGFFIKNLITMSTPWGRRIMSSAMGKGASPLIRVMPEDLDNAGIERVARITGAADGLPVMADGSVIEPANIIWCTGFQRRHGYLDLPGAPGDKSLEQYRGVATGEPGLYVVGQPFQYSFPSHTVDGVGRDARYVVRKIMKAKKRR